MKPITIFIEIRENKFIPIRTTDPFARRLLRPSIREQIMAERNPEKEARWEQREWN